MVILCNLSSYQAVKRSHNTRPQTKNPIRPRQTLQRPFYSDQKNIFLHFFWIWYGYERSILPFKLAQQNKKFGICLGYFAT